MRVLISFASTEGQTHKIAKRIADRITQRGHDVAVYDNQSVYEVPDVEAFDAILVAGSVHEALHQDSIVNFASAHRAQLSSKRSAFISVSLSAASQDGQADAQGYLDRFTAVTAWVPRDTLLIGGALRYSQCDYFERQVVQAIARRQGVTPIDEGNYEFTDWEAVDRFVDRFLMKN